MFGFILILVYGLPISIVIAGIAAFFYQSRREDLLKYIKNALKVWAAFWVFAFVFGMVSVYRFIEKTREHTVYWDEKEITTLVAGDTYDYTDFIEITRNDSNYSVDFYIQNVDSEEKLILNDDGSVTIPADFESDVYVHIKAPGHDGREYVKRFCIQN